MGEMDFETFANAKIHKFIGGPLDGMEIEMPAGKVMWSEVMCDLLLRYYYEDIPETPLRAWYKLGGCCEKRSANVPGQEDVSVILFSHIGNTSQSCTEPPDEEYREQRRRAEARERQRAKEDAELERYMEECRQAYEDYQEEIHREKETRENFQQRHSRIHSWFKKIFRS